VFADCIERFRAFKVPFWSSIPTGLYPRLAEKAEMLMVRPCQSLSLPCHDAEDDVEVRS
jgi:hypothetical protein